MLIWQKYILKKLFFSFFFFLICLFSVYSIVDLSAHGVRFLSRATLSQIFQFYLFSFSTLLDLFLSLTFLLTSIKVLYDLNTHREIVALQMASLSKKKLLLPFFLFAAILSSISYANTEWLYPNTCEKTNTFKNNYKLKKKKTEKMTLFTTALADESELIYQSFNKKEKKLFDVFWVQNPADIWHMKTFAVETRIGSFVNHLIRKDKQLEKSESFKSKYFPEIKLKENLLLSLIPFERQNISTLFKQAYTESSKKRVIFSHLFYKLLIPLMPFLIIIAISPFSLKFSRPPPFFLITAYALFAFIALRIIIDGMLILGENQVLPSFVAIFTPFLGVLAFTIPQFARLR